MKHAEKNRDQARARQRALTDARCAVRKLQAWADDVCAGLSRTKLDTALALVEEAHAELQAMQDSKDRKASA